MNKYFFSSAPFLFFLIFTLVVFKQNTFKSTSKRETVQTYIKQDKSISSHQTTSSELKAKLSFTTKVNKSKKNGTNFQLIDKSGKPLEADSNSLKFINKIHPAWEEKMAFHLLRFMKIDTKIIVEREKSFIEVEQNLGRYLEQVIVSFLANDKIVSGYRALVDPQNGKIMRVWDRMIWENYRQKRWTMTPSGKL